MSKMQIENLLFNKKLHRLRKEERYRGAYRNAPTRLLDRPRRSQSLEPKWPQANLIDMSLRTSILRILVRAHCLRSSRSRSSYNLTRPGAPGRKLGTPRPSKIVPRSGPHCYGVRSRSWTCAPKIPAPKAPKGIQPSKITRNLRALRPLGSLSPYRRRAPV